MIIVIIIITTNWNPSESTIFVTSDVQAIINQDREEATEIVGGIQKMGTM